MTDTGYDSRLDRVCRDRGIYPSAPYPGMCWLLENVFVIDPNTVTEDGFGTDGVECFQIDENGKRIYDQTDAKKMFHYWSEEEILLLDEWWDFIPPRFRRALRKFEDD